MEIKNLVLQSVTKNEALAEKTSSGGRLDIGTAMQRLNKIYSIPENDISAEIWGQNEVLIRFSSELKGPYIYQIYDVSGRLRYKGNMEGNCDSGCRIILDWDLPKNEIYLLKVSDKTGKRIGSFKF